MYLFKQDVLINLSLKIITTWIKITSVTPITAVA